MPRLTEEQLRFFHAEGYVHVAAGKIKRDYAELPFTKRLIPLAKADASATAGINFPANLGPNIFAFLHNPRLLALLESLIGPEIYANSCQHIRAKVPANDEYAGNFSQNEWARSTAWHQDLGVLLPEADDTLIVTTWIPLVDADEENGTLMIYPRCHQEPLRQHVRQHVRPPADQGGSFTVAPEELPPWDPVTIPVQRGGLIAIHCRTPHGSQPNGSDAIRWSMDLRWNDARKPNGRPHLPGLLVRSQEHPELVVHDRQEWLTAWKLARVSSRGARTYRWI